MRKEMKVLLIVAALSLSILGAGSVQAQEENDQANLATLVNTLDTSISSLRKGEGARELIEQASDDYDNYFSSRVATVDNSLDNKIRNAFISLKENPVEGDIFALRSDVLRAASLIGISLPPLYAYSLFIILGIGVVVSLLVTLLNKRLVNWDLVRENKAKVAEFQKELREARSKKDMKQMHKLQQRQSEIVKLQGAMFKQTFKPMIIYLIPLLLIWTILLNVFSGWVVAWLPFRIDLPIFGSMVAFGVGWWYFIIYLGFSQIFRKILIRD